MSRLPIVGADSASWGNVLNDYLTETASVAVLASSPTAGATTFDLAVVPPGLRVGSVVAIDAFTTQCELRAVTGISGQTITVARLMFAHAAGDTMMLIHDAVVPVSYFGLVGDTTDEWSPLQRLVKEATNLNQQIRGDRGIYYFQQPLLVNTSSWLDHFTIRTRTGFSPVEDVGAAVLVGNGEFFFKATDSGDLFTCTESDHTTAASHNLSTDIPIVFSAPYGETLPGGITSGKVYYVKTIPTSSTFTVSETIGGATVSVTADGSGWSVNNVGDGLARVFWEAFFLFLTVADLHGLRAHLQQPSWTRNLRIEMSASASNPGDAVGFLLSGQLSYHDNVEINPAENCTGMTVVGTGHEIRGFNANGTNSGDTGLVLGGDSNSVLTPWTESHARAGIEISSARNARVIGPWVSADFGPSLLVTDNTNSYGVEQIRVNGTGKTVVSDTSRTYEDIVAYTSATVGETDITLCFFGLTQGAGDIPPELRHRWEKTIITSYTVQRSVRLVRCANNTITLPSASGWRGHTTTIASVDGPVTVVPSGSETINGAASLSLAAGEAATVVADGSAGYQIVGHNPSSVLQTYTPTNVSTDRSFDADTVLVSELADVVGTLIADLQAKKVVG